MSEVSEPNPLRDALAQIGVPADELDRAEAEETLALLAIDHLVLPGEERYNEADVAERSGMPIELSRRFWRALGFPDVGEDDRVFTDDDIEALKTAAYLLQQGVVEPQLALQMTRVMASSMARVAEVQVDVAQERARRRAMDGQLLVDTDALFHTPRLLEYIWRRQLQAAARRVWLRGTLAEETPAVAVGFADLVGFTAMSQQISEHELAEVVDRFSELAYDTVAGLGGRVVKTIGDEVMFVVDDVPSGVEIALTLAETYGVDEALSDVRVGLACGQVLARDGDLYGPVVNLAGRIVSLAYPGSVVVSEDVHEALSDDERLRWRSLRSRNLKGIGRVRLWRVRRADPPPDGG